MKIKPTLTTLALMNLNLRAQIENQSSVNEFWAEIANTWATMVDKYLPLVWKELMPTFERWKGIVVLLKSREAFRRKNKFCYVLIS